MKDNFSILKYILSLFIGWRLAVLFISYLGLSYLPLYSGANHLPFYSTSAIDYWIRWANWDGGYFRSIADHGYTATQTVFFPFYPILIKTLTPFGLSALWAGLIVSNLMAILALFYFYKLALLDFKDKVAKRMIFALLIFPTSFYLGAVYTESTFLAITLAAFYYARKKHWLAAFVLAGLALVTRSAGIAVIVGITAEYFLKEINFSFFSLFQTSLRRFLILFLGINLILSFFQSAVISTGHLLLAGIWVSLAPFMLYILLFLTFLAGIELLVKNLDSSRFLTIPTLYVFLSFIPLASFMLFQKNTFGSLTGFITNQQIWTRHFSFPWQSITESFQMVQLSFLSIGANAQTLLEFLNFILVSATLVFSFFKLRASYTIYLLVSLLLPLFTGSLMSTIRFTITIFPVFMILGLIENEFLQKIGIFLFTMILALFLIRYINGYWIV